MATETIGAPSGELAEGHCGFGSAGEIDHSLIGRELSLREDLLEKQRHQIAGVEAVADLVALAIEADVAERAAVEVGVDPIGEDTLIGATELPSSGHDSTAVDKNLETERLPVFQREHFAGEFCGSVKRDRRLCGKFLADAAGRETGNRRLETRNFWRVGVVTNLNREGSERRDRVDPARAEQHKGGLTGLAEFQQIYGAEKVVFNQLARAGFAIHAGKDARVGSCIDNGIDFGNPFEIASGADVSVQDFDAESLEC